MSQSSLPSGQPASFADTSNSARARILATKRRNRFIQVFGYFILSIAFPTAVWYAGKAGISLALKSLPEHRGNGSLFPDGHALALGGQNTPLYLADSPESLREFYLNFPDELSRAEATEFNAYGMRRVFSGLDVTIQRYDADAVQVKVTSGSISGAIYWIHISLLQEIPSQHRGEGEIISPIPSR